MIVTQMQTVKTHLEVMTAIAKLDSLEMDLHVEVGHQSVEQISTSICYNVNFEYSVSYFLRPRQDYRRCLAAVVFLIHNAPAYHTLALHSICAAIPY